MPFTWSERFDIGVEAMNAEHQMIVTKMNHIEALAERGASKRELQEAIDDLGRYTVQHFAEEEAYMERIGFPQLAAHRHVHANMLTKYQEFTGVFGRGDGKLPDGFLQFLNFWLRAHICGIDKRYGDFAASRP
ncbi:MAG: bacteriohemerythrin [Myxococcota bacterium]